MKSTIFNLKKEEDFNRYYPTLNKWWKDWEMSPIAPSGLGALPTFGIIVSNKEVDICAGWLFLTDSHTAIIGSLISSRDKTPLRKGCIEYLLLELEGLAKNMGFKAVMTPASHPNLRNKLVKLGHGDHVEKKYKLFQEYIMGEAFNLIGNAGGTTTRVGGVVGGYLASNRAARAERKNAGQRLDYAQNREQSALGYLDPYAGAGEEALSPLTGLLTGKQYNPDTGAYDTINQQERLSLFQESPDYQYRLQQGQKALESSQSARGGLLSGRAAIEAQTQGQGQAAGEYGNYLQRLYSLATMGQNAATNQANIVQGNTGALTSLYGQAQGSAYDAQKWNNFSNAWQTGSEYVAQNHEKAGQSLSKMFSAQGMMGGMMGGGGGMAGGGMAGGGSQMSPGMSSIGTTGAGGSTFSDIKLKKNIEEVGKSESGIPIYHFDYKDKKHGVGRFEGVMAQDILRLKPEAVLKEDDYLKVDYSQLDVDFRRL